MIETIVTSVFAFASTNLDDIFILMLFFGSRRFTPANIIIGQYAGIISLIVISLLISLLGNFIDPRYIGFLGLFPIYLAIKQCIAWIRSADSDSQEEAVQKQGNAILVVAGVTIANGSDNIGVYVPLFAQQTITGQWIMIAIFMLMTWLWCLLGMYLLRNPVMAKAIERYGHIAMPIVFMILGIFILVESRAFSVFFS